MDADHVSILLDIKSQVGALSAQNIEAARQRARLEDGQRETRDMLVPLVGTVAEMKPNVDDLMALKNKFGGVILTLSVFWALICAGFVYFSDIIKAKLPH